MKKNISDFKKFLLKGNVIDLAVAVVIGGAFGKIVTSLVNDIIMPTIGLLLGKINFTNLKIIVKAATDTTEEVAIRYGTFIQTIIDFLIIGLSIFIVIKLFERFRKKKEEKTPPPKPSNEEILLAEIRDLLKK